MVILRNDGLSRPVKRESQRRRPLGQTSVFFVLVFASVALLVLDRAQHSLIAAIRSRATDLLAPVVEVASVPAIQVQHLRRQLTSYLELFEELERIRIENQKLQQWEWRAHQLEQEVERYRDLLNGVKESPFRFVTGRVISEGRGPFVRSCLVNVGSIHGVRNGFAVVNADGLVGRTLDTGEKVTRVLLVTDLNSRLPVVIGTAGARGIMIGDSSDHPQIAFTAKGVVIAEGDQVATSGEDGVLPRGIRIGTIVKTDAGFAVKLYAEVGALDYVSILFADTPKLDLVDATMRASRVVRSEK